MRILKRSTALLLVLVLILAPVPPQLFAEESPSLISPSSTTTAFSDWASAISFLDPASTGAYGTAPIGTGTGSAASTGSSNLVPRMTAANANVVRATGSGSPAWNAFDHFRYTPNVQIGNWWASNTATGMQRPATGNVGIAIDLLDGAPADAPWPVADTVILHVTRQNGSAPFGFDPTSASRGIARISIESGSSSAWSALGGNTWGDIVDNPTGLNILEDELGSEWRTFGQVHSMPSPNSDAVFVFRTDNPVPVRYLKAMVEITVPPGPGNLPGNHVLIPSFEVYNSQAAVPPSSVHNFPNWPTALAFLDPADTGAFGAAPIGTGPGSAAPTVNMNLVPNITGPSAAVRSTPSGGAVGGAAWNAFDHFRRTPNNVQQGNWWATNTATGLRRPETGSVGIAIDLLDGAPADTPWPMADTVVLHVTRQNGSPAYVFGNTPTNRGITRMSIESGSAAAWEQLSGSTWGDIVDNTTGLDSLEGELGLEWRTFGAVNNLTSPPLNQYAVFVFRTGTPVPVRYLKAMIEIYVPPNAGDLPGIHVLVPSFEVFNSQDGPQVILPPTASPAPGHFTTPQTVTLSAAAGTTIRFTTDGTTPTATTGEIFTAPITIADSTTIRAIAVLGDEISPMAEFVYTISEFAPSPFAEHYLTQRGVGFAVISARYDGMSNVIGRPALVDATRAVDRFPVFDIIDGLPGTVITGQLYGPNGQVVYTIDPLTVPEGGRDVITIPDTVPLVANTTYRMAFTLTYNSQTFFDARYFTAIYNFDQFRATPNLQNSNNANVANIHVDNVANAHRALQFGDDGSLRYYPDYRGNRIMDFSGVGFRGGEQIPNVPVIREIGPFQDPYRDAWAMIQRAIDEVSALPLDENGFRGALYLREGVYRISRPLLVSASGVVIRGAGSGLPAPDQLSVSRYLYPYETSHVPGSAQNPMISRRACQEFEPGVTKLISTWQLFPDNTNVSANHNQSAGQFRTDSVSLNLESSENWDTLVHFIGQNIMGTGVAFRANVLDQYVGIGSTTIHLDDVSGLSVGDIIFVYRGIDENWAHVTYMSSEPNNPWAANGELAPGFRPAPEAALFQEVRILDINSTTGAIIFDVPMTDVLDMRWGTSYILRFNHDPRITNVGIENIQGISHFQSDSKPRIDILGISLYSYNDENHPMQFISMAFVKDAWARDWVSYHFDRGFTTQLSANITVQDAYVLEPVSLANGGGHRYAFFIRRSTRVLVQRGYANFSRHAFTWTFYVSGPNVIFDSSAPFQTNSSEPHMRWSSGGLFDNVRARIAINNRWEWGTSQGWPGVNYIMYNTFGPFVISQPQIAPNFILGHYWTDTLENRRRYSHTGDIVTGRFAFQRGSVANDVLLARGLNAGAVPNLPAYEYGIGRGRPLNPADDNMPSSLFLQQIADARGAAAVDIIIDNRMPPRDQWIAHPDKVIDPPDETEALFLSSLTIGGVPVPGFAPTRFFYNFTLPFGFVAFPEIAATTDQNADITVEIVGMQAIITLTDREWAHNIEIYRINFDTPDVFPVLTANADPQYSVNLLLGNTSHHTANLYRWSSNMTPSWVRIYLGPVPKTVVGVNLGFVPGNDVRRNLARFEYSVDGGTWHEITNGTVHSSHNPTPVPWEFLERAGGSFVLSLPTDGRETLINPPNDFQTFMFDVPAEATFIRVLSDGRLVGNAVNAWFNIFHVSPVFPEGVSIVDSESIQVSGANIVQVGQQINLTATVYPVNATYSIPRWISSDESIATVSTGGVVTGISPGTVTITAHTLDGTVIPNTRVVPFDTTTHEITVTMDATTGPFTFTLENFSPPGMTPQEYIHTLDAGETLSRIVNGFGLNQHGGIIRGGEVIADGWVRNFQLRDWVVVSPESFELGGTAWSNRTVTMPDSNVTLQGDWEQHGGRYAIIIFNANNGAFCDAETEVEKRSRIHEYWDGGSRPFQNIVTLDTLAPTPEKAGYDFVGWALAADGEVLDVDTRLDTPKTLYAIWEWIYVPAPPRIVEVVPNPVTVQQGGTATITVVTENMPAGAWVDLNVAWHPGLSVVGGPDGCFASCSPMHPGPRFYIGEDGTAVVTVAATASAPLGQDGFGLAARVADQWGAPVILDSTILVITVIEPPIPLITAVNPNPVTIQRSGTIEIEVVTENMPVGTWIDANVAWHPGLSVVGGSRFYVNESGVAVITLAAAADAQLGSNGFSVVAHVAGEWGSNIIVDSSLFVINVV